MPPHPALDWRELPVRLVSGHPPRDRPALLRRQMISCFIGPDPLELVP